MNNSHDAKTVRTQAVATMLVGSVSGAGLSLLADRFLKPPLPTWFYMGLGILTISTLIVFSVAILLEKQSLNILTIFLVGAGFFWLSLFATSQLASSAQVADTQSGGDPPTASVIYLQPTIIITPIIVTATPEHFAAPNPVTESTPVPPTEPQPEVQEITQLAQITAAKAAAASKDTCEPPHTTSYNATNLTDDQSDTAWRVSGQGNGAYVLLEFPYLVAIRQVDIIPGYAKVDPCTQNYDWCQRNHIPRNIRIEFSNGIRLDYRLQDTCQWQNLGLDDIETRWLRLTIIDSYPNKVSHYADFTAISEIRVYGWIK